MNKITNTRVGDEINFFVNGVEDSGIVVKMNNAYVTVFKSGEYKDIQLNETFFVKDIVVNKTWDAMDDNEKLEELSKAHVPSPRYVTKSWDQLPKDLQVLLTKNNSSNVSAKEGKDDDENVTHRIFDKASSGDNNTLTESGGEGASSNSMVTDPKKRSGGFKLNTPIGTEGMAGEKGDKGFGQTMMTRQHGIKPRDPSTEEQKGVKRGGKHDSKENKEALGSSEVKLFSGYDDKGDSKGYNDKAWVSWLADRKDDIMKDSLLKIEDEHDKNTKVEVLDEWKNDDNDSGEDKKKPSKLEKAIEKLNQLKSNVEESVHGNAGREPNSGVSTSTGFDAPKDYEGASHTGVRADQFKYDDKKPSIKKENLDLGDTKPSDTHDGGNKYDTKTQPKTINGRAADQEKDKKI